MKIMCRILILLIPVHISGGGIYGTPVALSHSAQLCYADR